MELKLWKDREQKTLDPHLFSTQAEEFARQINNEGGRSMNKGTQLRKFFDEILRLNTLAQPEDADWNLLLPQVHMVIAKAAYAQGRKLVSTGFVNHIRQGIEQVETPADLMVFTNHMEAFMGYYKIYS
ncbi:MAG: type III-A CRISPR-associated protein Csm2 [Thermodesulfobacteriota bacterium]|nr:type III-A CRISPR-associated protein Csm2 [Thermodesulfobacteriota bacterium]